jgi:hypothetical protein
MRTTWTNHTIAALMSVLAWGIAGQASAQEPGQPLEPDLPQVPDQPQLPDQPQAMEMQTPATTDEATLPESVPSYEPPAYTLTPPGSAAEGRSETKVWPNRPLLLTSTLIFTAAYVPAVLTAAFSEEDTTDNLYIPVAGPWLELSQEEATTGNKALLGISGVFQGLGALGMLTSLMVPERRTSRWYLLGTKRLAISPATSPRAYGVSASGRF